MVKMKIGITGMAGFVGTHLRDRLRREEHITVKPFEDAFFDDATTLRSYLADCDVVFHLAALNRGEPDDIYNINVELVQKLIDQLEAAQATPHIIFSSSIQCRLDNPYGRAKKEGARLLKEWSNKHRAPVTTLIIPNVFGDACRTHYHSVVATFCYELTHGGKPEIKVDKPLDLIYINALVEAMAVRMQNPPHGYVEEELPGTGSATVKEVLAILQRFGEYYYEKRTVPHFDTHFQRDLYNTFITYMDAADFERPATVHTDDRGSLFEVVKQEGAGQVFFSTTKPGITRGNHYHTRKQEKFCVVKGRAAIRLRRIGTDKVIEYQVSGEKPVSIEMPIYHTHNITNTGEDELLTLFWTNELFDPQDPDTFFEKV